MSMPPRGHLAHPEMSWAYGPGSPLGPPLCSGSPGWTVEEEEAESRRHAARDAQLRNAPSQLMELLRKSPPRLRERLGPSSDLCPSGARGWPVAESELGDYWITESGQIIVFVPGPNEGELLHESRGAAISERYGLAGPLKHLAASPRALRRARRKDELLQRKGASQGNEPRFFDPMANDSLAMQNACSIMIQRFQRALNS